MLCLQRFFFYSDYIQAPFSTNYYKTEYTNITKYDDYTFSMSVPKVKPDMASRVLQITPVPEHFYTELGPDFPERYQWRYEPHAGAYYIDPDEINMGVNLVVHRLEDWWAKDMKYYRHRYNPDRIVLNSSPGPGPSASRRSGAVILTLCASALRKPGTICCLMTTQT